LRVGDDLEGGEEDEVQNPMPMGDRERSVEDGVDPPSLEGAQSERDVVIEQQAEHARPDFADFGSKP